MSDGTRKTPKHQKHPLTTILLDETYPNGPTRTPRGDHWSKSQSLAGGLISLLRCLSSRAAGSKSSGNTAGSKSGQTTSEDTPEPSASSTGVCYHLPNVCHDLRGGCREALLVSRAWLSSRTRLTLDIAKSHGLWLMKELLFHQP